MGLGVGFPQRLVAEKVTSRMCPWKIYLTCPLIGQAALISTEKKINFGEPHQPDCWHTKCTPLTPKHSQCWWLVRSVTFVCLFVLCLQWPHCWCLSTPLLLWQRIISLSMSTSCRKKQSLKMSAGGQADVRSRHWALGLSLPTSEFLGRKLPTLSEPFLSS